MIYFNKNLALHKLNMQMFFKLIHIIHITACKLLFIVIFPCLNIITLFCN